MLGGLNKTGLILSQSLLGEFRVVATLLTLAKIVRRKGIVLLLPTVRVVAVTVSGSLSFTWLVVIFRA